MRAAVPPVEVTDDAHPLGVGCPDRKMHPGHAADVDPVGAELFPRAVVRPLGDEVQVEVGQHLTELIGIDDLAGVAAFVHAKPVCKLLGLAVVQCDEGLEDAFGAPALHLDLAPRRDELDPIDRRLNCAENERPASPVGANMAAEQREGIIVGAEYEGIERLVLCRSNNRAHHAIVQWGQ